MPEKEHVNVVFVGHVDHGKSTLIGRLFWDAGLIKELPPEEQAHDAKFAWVVDRLKEERERGMTIDLFHTKIETPKRMITIIDAPGHRDFVKNMITGASQADAAILVVSAKQGEGVQEQTREHVYLVRTLGVNQLAVAITKMDDPTVNYSKERFEQLKEEVSDLLRKVGFDPSKIQFVPCSGLVGDNVYKRSENMPWYDGPTLYEVMDTFTAPPKPVDKPLRLPIQDVFTITGVGTVAVGRVETGVLKPGDKVIIEPIHKVAEAKSIEMHHQRLEKAIPGDNIGVNLKGVEKKEIRRGDVIGHVDNPPTVVDEFTAQIVILSHPTAIAAGYTPVLHAHTGHVAAKMVELVRKLDPRTGQVIEESPSYLRKGDAAIVRFKPIKPFVLEKYSEFPPLGRFAIRDMGMTIGAGIVLDVKPIERKK
ncbi:MAG: translation elongation factor EF-1 subunit alpha [Thermoproteota archaeon]|nr:MAG: translation elongation factor EF-1 subunit alpha [Candidatus Korarchaeota archaeon]